LMKPNALLFDFYGTIVEEADEYVDRVCEKVLQCSNVELSPDEMWRYWYGVHVEMCGNAFHNTFRSQKDIAETSLKALLRKVRCPLESKQLIEIIIRFWKSPGILPESAEVLSNIDNSEINAALVKHNLHFDHVITSEACRAYEPRKEVFEKALALLNMKPGEVLHVGDSYAIDVVVAKAAGIPVVWVNRRNKQLAAGDATPDYEIGGLSGLLHIMQ
jgi:FMN phosphatase YigB (HAD superfamily)